MSSRNSRARDVRLFTEPEAADRLGVCTETLARLRRAGRIGHVMVGGCVRYSGELLIAFTDAHTRHQGNPDALDTQVEQSQAA